MRGARRKRKRRDTAAGAGHGGLRGGERAAAGAGGAGTRDRGLPAERRHGDPGAVEGEGGGAAAGAPGRPVQRRRPEGRVGAVGADPLPHPGGHGAAPRGLQLRGPQGLPDGPQPRRLRPPQAGRAGARLRADAGALSGRRAPGTRRGHAKDTPRTRARAGTCCMASPPPASCEVRVSLVRHRRLHVRNTPRTRQGHTRDTPRTRAGAGTCYMASPPPASCEAPVSLVRRRRLHVRNTPRTRQGHGCAFTTPSRAIGV